MITYEYRCSDCGKEFTRQEPIGEHGATPPRCPECQSEKVDQKLAAAYVKTSKKS